MTFISYFYSMRESCRTELLSSSWIAEVEQELHLQRDFHQSVHFLFTPTIGSIAPCSADAPPKRITAASACYGFEISNINSLVQKRLTVTSV